MRAVLVWGVPSVVGLVVLGLVTATSLASPNRGVRAEAAADVPAVVAKGVDGRSAR